MESATECLFRFLVLSVLMEIANRLYLGNMYGVTPAGMF